VPFKIYGLAGSRVARLTLRGTLWGNILTLKKHASILGLGHSSFVLRRETWGTLVLIILFIHLLNCLYGVPVGFWLVALGCI
jgi:hypothetical protein